MTHFAPHRLMTATLVVLTVLVFAFSPARADDDAPVGDQIILGLSLEDYVEAEKPLVRIDINASFKGSETGTARADINKSLKALAPKADWKITRINRNQDKSGLERWYINAEARLDEATLSGLDNKSRAQSKPGFNVEVGAVQWHPTRAEREAAYTELRKKIYEQAKAELKAANDAFEGRAYRIAYVDFGGHGPVMPITRSHAPMAAMAQAEMRGKSNFVADAAPSGGISVSELIIVGATVVLEAVPPKAE